MIRQGNPRVRILKEEMLSDNWYVLKKMTFEYQKQDDTWETQAREVYDRGNGATILLYNRAKQTVVLTKQFRMPTYVNGNDTGMLIETCAGLLDRETPEASIVRETEEETGYRVSEIVKVGEAYMSPGSVTEILHFYSSRRSKWCEPAKSAMPKRSCCCSMRKFTDFLSRRSSRCIFLSPDRIAQELGTIPSFWSKTSAL
ncbi:NUDIX domain-containing protein [Paenibacillus elgii]|uniref:NUDIX domain-containing protein n=1 Tax=Paenibacillus elgii TaxID=189691 RepID=UPI000248D5A5|nr:NUDIX domain-containing protein [Paenibacillus elgii]